MKILKRIFLRSRMKNIKSYGLDVWIGKYCTFLGNVEIGSHVNIGRGANFVSTMATVHIHDYVVMGPEVAIYTGDHATDIIGKHIIEIADSDKMTAGNGTSKYDADVTIESGCWIGTRAIILKGVTVGKGSVIGAGAVVTKDVPPYSIYTGVPSARLKSRFTEEQINEHEKKLLERGLSPDSFYNSYLIRK